MFDFTILENESNTAAPSPNAPATGNAPLKRASIKMIVPTLVLEFSLKIILFALGLTIFHVYNTSASISQTKQEFVASRGYLIVGIFNMVLNMAALFKYACKWEAVGLADFVTLFNVILDLVGEGLLFRSVTCHNQASNEIVVARGLLAIAYVLAQYANLSMSYFILRSQPDGKKYYTHAGLSVFFALAITSLLVLNSIVLAGLEPPLNHQIGPHNIQMGFFNPAEVSLLQKGAFTKENEFESRLVGNLSDVLFSKKKTYSYGTFKDNFYWRLYTFEVTCSNEARKFYADCFNDAVASLTVFVRFLDDYDDYPSYSCLVNTYDQKCAGKCERLYRAKYDLVLVQQFEDKVETAWTGLSRCNERPSVRLLRNDQLSPCIMASSRATSLFRVWRVLAFYLVLTLVVFFL